jgi:hypothetical protein
VHARRPAQGIHLETGIVRQDQDLAGLGAAPGPLPQPRGQGHRLLGGIAGERRRILDHRRRVRKIVQRPVLEPVAQHRAYFLDLVRVPRSDH